jgi:hypothetical protein
VLDVARKSGVSVGIPRNGSAEKHLENGPLAKSLPQDGA